MFWNAGLSSCWYLRPGQAPMKLLMQSPATCLVSFRPYGERYGVRLSPNARPSETSTAGITPDQDGLPLMYARLCAKSTGMPPSATPTMFRFGAYLGASSEANSVAIEPPEYPTI